MIRRRYWFLLLLVLVSISIPVAILTATLPRRNEALLTSPNSWKGRGNVRHYVQDSSYVFAHAIERLYFVFGRFTGDGSGAMASLPFKAPACIGISVRGDLTRPENEVYFHLLKQSPQDREAESQKIRVNVRTPTYVMRQVTLKLPAEWEGKYMEVLVQAGPREESNAFAVSNPRAFGSGTVMVTHLEALAALPAFAAALILFLAPGLFPAMRLAVRGLITPLMILPVAIVLACLAGWVTFWAYFLNPNFGFEFGRAILLGSLALCAFDLAWNRQTRSLLFSGEFPITFALMSVVGLFYVALWLSVSLWTSTSLGDSARLRFFEFMLSRDSDIPHIFAEYLFTGREPRGELMGEWHFSDRPPLQAGLLLLQLPVGNMFGQRASWSQLAAIAFQCSWVPAVWSLMRSSGLARGRAGLALLFMVLTGFTLVNTVFTWPKILPAGLVVFAVTTGLFYRGPRGQAFPLGKAVLIGLSAALASLGHGGVAFTLLPFGLFLLLPRYYPGITRLAVAAIVYLVTMSPWTWFQNVYDPPGNRLVRQHVADRDREWDEDRSTLWNVVASYKGRDIHEILDNKWANLRALFRASGNPPDEQYPWPPDGSPKPFPVDLTSFRRCEFMCLFWAPGLMNLGWLVALVRIWRRPAEGAGPGFPVALLGLAAALAWVMVMFGPGSTVIHQGSYATVLLLFASLAGWLATLPGVLPYLLLVAHAAVFAGGWLLTSPANDFGLPNWFMIVTAFLSFAALARVALGPASIKNLRSDWRIRKP